MTKTTTPKCKETESCYWTGLNPYFGQTGSTFLKRINIFYVKNLFFLLSFFYNRRAMGEINLHPTITQNDFPSDIKPKVRSLEQTIIF